MRTVVTLLSLAGYGVPALPWPEYGTRDPLHNPLLHILFPHSVSFLLLCAQNVYLSHCGELILRVLSFDFPAQFKERTDELQLHKT